MYIYIFNIFIKSKDKSLCFTWKPESHAWWILIHIRFTGKLALCHWRLRFCTLMILGSVDGRWMVDIRCSMDSFSSVALECLLRPVSPFSFLVTINQLSMAEARLVKDKVFLSLGSLAEPQGGMVTWWLWPLLCAGLKLKWRSLRYVFSMLLHLSNSYAHL